ncbi:hypothetical protein [Anaerocellum danielii]|uniref:Uncharacterized protein n=1 Tax=Anaerocellum danielii TaxID=1387557 RepID=A0ABZ0TXP9_9FIRM|nr:hypothetical protein [Caldicellulosiruptor danielii]WPX08200.1 hypothetical protein SOJ16_002066 [Caldicellulosiruptor danielii]
MSYIYNLVKDFVRENWESNKFIRKVLIDEPVYWQSNTDTKIIRGIYNTLEGGIDFDNKKMKELFNQHRSDIMTYLERLLDEEFRDFLFKLEFEDAETPLYEFIMQIVLNDVVNCLGRYIIEQLENDYPELKDTDCLLCGLEMLLQQLQKDNYQKELQESATEYLEHISGYDQFDL